MNEDIFANIISMNSSSVYSTSSTRQLSDSSSGAGDAIVPALVGSFGFLVLSLLISLIIFIIWVWSMISMINLNIRFKVFLEEYRMKEREEVSGNTSYRQQSTNESADNERIEELRNYKTEEQGKADRAEKLANMKPRRFYVWAAISVPILLAVLAVVAILSS